MKAGIARKLAATYITIIIATIISGIFCFYSLNKNQSANTEMRYVSLPSLEYLNQMRKLQMDIKKLSNTWVFVVNNRDHERLLNIVNYEFPALSNKMDTIVRRWTDVNEIQLYNTIKLNNKLAIDTIRKITLLLGSPESYTIDSAVDAAALFSTHADQVITANDKLYTRLIETKEEHLESTQNAIGKLMKVLYLIISLTILIVITVSSFSMRFSTQNITTPLLELKDIILQIAVGKVVDIKDTKRVDEIGQMHNAVNKMMSGVIQKINFSEQLGKGNYDQEFTLLSENDTLGIALINMRNDLQRTNEAIIEQGKRLTDAQRIAMLGNYFYEISTGTFQSSATFDEILGIDETFLKTRENWIALIAPEFRSHTPKIVLGAIDSKKRFSENYIINRYITGEERWVNVIGECSLDESGKVVSVKGTLQDITENKVLELELNSSYTLAVEQNKRLQNFSYIVSHNLRMHTVNIESMLRLLDEAESPEETKELLDMLRQASAGLDETLHNLNEVVAMQNSVNIESTPQVLNEHVKNALNVLKTQIDSKKALIINKVADEIVINYNPAYLESIVLNFISNAVKYSHPGRQPTVTIDYQQVKGSLIKHKGVLEISDNGLGIDMKKNEHKLFGMYKTFHGNKDARGMGLFMTKYQIESMGGRVEVQSELNKGTTFRVYIN